MPEEFKRQIDTKIDTAVTSAVESSDTEKLDELRGKADTLRKSLKGAIAEAHTEDEEITDDEWKEIFESLPADLLDEFGINTQNGLQDFVLGKEKLPDGEIKRIADEIISDSDYSLASEFFDKTILTLSQEDAGEIVYLLAKAGILGGILSGAFYLRLKYFKDSPRIKDIFMEAAKVNSALVFIQFDLISHYPWAVETLFVAARKLPPEEIRNRLDSVNGLSDQEKSKILEIAVAKERSEPILRLLVDREYGAVQGYATAQGKDVDQEKEKVLEGIRSDPALQHIGEIEKEWVRDLATVQIADLEAAAEAVLPNYKHDLEQDSAFKVDP